MEEKVCRYGEVPPGEMMELGRFLALESDKQIEILSALDIVEQALALFRGFYAHLALKRSLHGADPVRRLRRLRKRLRGEQRERLAEGETRIETPAIPFHREMSEIFIAMRDRHMSYKWPEPFRSHWAWLGCEIEEYFQQSSPRYLISRVSPALQKDGSLEAGAEVVTWNGIPIERAVELCGERQPGSNPEARRALGVARLTLVPLSHAPPPEEHVVHLEWLPPAATGEAPAPGSEPRSSRLTWQVVPYGDRRLSNTCGEPEGAGRRPRRVRELAIDFGADQVRKLRQHLCGFDPADDPEGVLFSAEPLAAEPEDSPFRFTYLRLFSFGSTRTRKVLERIRDRVLELPQSGLVIDLRDNPGGNIELAELLLQALTGRPVDEALFQFPASEALDALCNLPSGSAPERIADWQRWGRSLRTSLRTGEPFSGAHPITGPRTHLEGMQVFWGPLVLITNARTYSSGDIFAAGFLDNALGTVIGVDGNTGAGGANVVDHQDLLAATRDAPALAGESGRGEAVQRELEAATGIRKLCEDVSMTTAVRRSLRVGAQAGRQLEHLGVEPQVRYELTREDLLDGNVELKKRAAALLLAADQPLLEVEWVPPADDRPRPQRGVDRRWAARIVHRRNIRRFEYSWINRARQVRRLAGATGAQGGSFPPPDPVFSTTTDPEATRTDPGLESFLLEVSNVPALDARCLVVLGLDAGDRVVAGWQLPVGGWREAERD